MLFSHFADSSSGLGALGVDFKAFLIQLITFVLALLVLKRYAFSPVIKVLRERRETIEQGVKLGEKMRQEESEMEAKVEKALHEARAKADGIIAEAGETARQVAAEAEEKAKSKAEGIVASAEERIQQDTALARQALERELVGLVSDATEVIINEKLDPKRDAQLIEKSLKKEGVA